MRFIDAPEVLSAAAEIIAEMGLDYQLIVTRGERGQVVDASTPDGGKFVWLCDEILKAIDLPESYANLRSSDYEVIGAYLTEEAIEVLKVLDEFSAWRTSWGVAFELACEKLGKMTGRYAYA